MNEAVIVAGVRTAVGRFGGGFKNFPVVDLGATVIKEVLKRAGLRPVVSDLMGACVPDKLKDQGLTDL
jgi:acetyl-CoA C-acetyltransferase